MHTRHFPTLRCCKAHAQIRASNGPGSGPAPGPRNNSNNNRNNKQLQPRAPPRLQQPARAVFNQPPIKHAPPPVFLEPAPPGAARQRPVPPSIAVPKVPPAAAASPATTIITTGSSSSSNAGQHRRAPSSSEQKLTPEQHKSAALIEELTAAAGVSGQAVNTHKLVSLYLEINTALQQGPHGFHPRSLVKYVSILDKTSQARQVSKEQLQVQLQAVISSVLVTGVKAFNLVQLSMLLHALARMGCRGQSMQQLMNMAMQHLQQLGTAAWLDKSSEVWQPITPAITMWAFGTAGFKGDVSPLIAAVNAAVAEGIMYAAPLQSWSNLLWGSAKLGVPWQNMEQVWDKGVAAVEGAALVAATKPQDVSNLLWACATAGYTCYGQLDRLAAVCSSAITGGVMETATPQAWANLLWAAAKLGISWQSMEQVWDQGVTAVGSSIGASPPNPQYVSNLLWACATVGYTCHGQLDRLTALCNAATTKGVMKTARPQNWANLLWAAAKLGLPWQNTLTEAFNVAVSKGVMKTATPQEWANSLWAAAKLGIPWQDMRSAWEHGIVAVEHAVDSMSLNSQNLANVSWACAKVGYTEQGAPGRLAVCCNKAVAGGLMKEATTQHWANILWSTSHLGVQADSIRPVWRAAVPALASSINRGTCHEVELRMALLAAAKSCYSQAISSWLPAAEVCMQQHSMLQSSTAGALSDTLAVLAQANVVAGLSQADKACLHRIAVQCAQSLAQHIQRGNVSKPLFNRAAASLATLSIKHPAFA